MAKSPKTASKPGTQRFLEDAQQAGFSKSEAEFLLRIFKILRALQNKQAAEAREVTSALNRRTIGLMKFG